MIDNPRRLLARLEIATSGYFNATGWFRTRATRRAIDAEGNPIPWFTYPFIAFISERVRHNWRVLEFGSGMGTLWWSKYVDHHTALEHDDQWAARTAKSSSAHVVSTSAIDPEEYIAPARSIGEFDIVIVDGLFRNECLIAACDLISPAGVIILDDAQRPEYASAIEAVREKGFRWLPFYGPQPVSKHAGCTAVLYRPENVLGI